MARAKLTVTELVPNGSLAQPAGTTGTTDGHYIEGVEAAELVLHVTIATATTTVTVKAGDYPPALESLQGDLSLSLATGSHFIGPFTSGRFQKDSTGAGTDADGQIWLDYGTAANVTVRALHVPRTA
jgi:hypothetical protein